MAFATTRQSGRLQKEIPILLIGSDTDGRLFAEETATVILSRHGAGVLSHYKLVPEQELILRCLDTNKETEVRVVGPIGSDEDSHIYGLAFIDLEKNFWGLDFPAATPEEANARTTLECSGCKQRQVFQHSEVESDVFKINGQLVRYCKRCSHSTIWKRAVGEIPPAESHSEPEPVVAARPAPQQPAPAVPGSHAAGSVPASSAKQGKPVRPEDRRRRPRAKVNFNGCVRYGGADEDIVVCEDMSRGGLRFKSSKRYYLNSIIQVAAPYTPGANVIFVTAEVVYVLELPEQKLFRCGVAFANSA